MIPKLLLFIGNDSEFIFCEELPYARCWDKAVIRTGLLSQVAGVEALTLPFTSNLLDIEFF